MFKHGCCFYRMAVIFLFSIVAVSCAYKSEDSSFIAKLDMVDALIAEGQVTDALKLLKKIEKKAYGSFSNLGIYRRYMQLGETEAAENTLKRSLRKNPGNAELSAVYSYFLMRHDRLSEAVKLSSGLAGTAYESIRAEVLLRENLKNKDFKSDWTSASYEGIYRAAYQRTLDTMWLRNCVSLYMADGAFDEAANLHPEYLYTPLDAFFWSLVMYNAEKFQKAAADLDKADQLVRDPYGTENYSDIRIETSALRSDIFIKSGDPAAAEGERQRLLQLMQSGQMQETLSPYDNIALPAVYVNSAYWAESQKNIEDRYKLLNYAVHNWPNYVPALIAYGKLAYDSSRPYNSDAYTEALQRAGLKTISMQQYDDLPKVSVADALERMAASLKYKKDPVLYIAKLSLQYATDKDSDNKLKLVDLWNLLEQNEKGTDMYPSVLVRYALHLLISCGEKSDAWNLFRKYISSRYSFTPAASFWDQFISVIRQTDVWECEYAGWFAADQHNAAAAKRLYEYAVYEDYKGKDRDISPFVSSESASNLAMIYSSTGNSSGALSLYSSICGLTDNTRLKAELLYRIACIQEKSGNDDLARQSLEYSISVDPDYEKASHMLHSMNK